MFRPTAIIATALVGGCVANNGGDKPMVVLGNQAVMSGGTGCMITPSMTGPFTSHGMINAQSPTAYVLNAVFESQIIAVAGQDLQRTIFLQGADVTLSIASTSLTTPTGSSSPAITLSGADASFKTLFSGPLAPNNAITAVGVDLIPTSALASILQQGGTTGTLSVEVIASMTGYGMLGGDRVNAVPFQYGVTVCTNCVIQNRGACPFTAVAMGDPCNPYQDGVVDCCTSNGQLICPAH